MPFPKLKKHFTATFEDVGTPEEMLRLRWFNADGTPGVVNFRVGLDVFLESPTLVSQVPDEQLLASLSMSAILGGGVLPGTSEFNAAIVNQESKNFQTIIGNVLLKSLTLLPDELPKGTIYDCVFQKVGAASNTKLVRADAWSISQYENRVDSGAHSVYVVPGSIHKQFALKASELTLENRAAIEEYVANKTYWV